VNENGTADLLIAFLVLWWVLKWWDY